MYLAHVIARQGNTYLVEDNEHKTQYHCHVRTNAIDAVCGDLVECEAASTSKHVIERVCPRKNQITRRDNFKREKTLAANIDHIIVVMAATPTYATPLIDKYLASALINRCKTTLVINKAELLNSNNLNISELEDTYQDLVDNFIVTSARLGYGIQTLRKVIANEVSILVGQSGVGKSSLINRLLNSNTIKVGELSENIQQGKHTTTNAYAHNINQHGKIIDSPGVRTFIPVFETIQDVMHGYKEFIPHINQCKFSDCHHISEPQCKIKQEVELGNIALSRYESYVENFHEVKNYST